MTTNTEHLIAACAKLIACGPNRERLDDVEACITLVRLEMHDRGELHMHMTEVTAVADRERRFICCECGATKTAPSILTGDQPLSDRETTIKQMLTAGSPVRRTSEAGDRLRTRREMAEDIYDAVVAPLLAEAERRGAELGWDAALVADGDRWQDGDLSQPLVNPYRTGADQ